MEQEQVAEHKENDAGEVKNVDYRKVKAKKEEYKVKGGYERSAVSGFGYVGGGGYDGGGGGWCDSGSGGGSGGGCDSGGGGGGGGCDSGGGGCDGGGICG